ncbi:hypothetical protein Btru_077752 [Bulinus truncatus]|nr:hypothetical protein Btru_077752 [Bulinus truncatus]
MFRRRGQLFDEGRRYRPVLVFSGERVGRPGQNFTKPRSGWNNNVYDGPVYNIYYPGSQANHLSSPTAEAAEEKILRVQSIDLNVADNTKTHHTKNYEICKSRVDSKLVVRRGQPFTIKITFSRAYDEQKDDLRLLFEAGDSPLPSKGTSVSIILSHEDIKNDWGAKIDSNQGNTLTITVFTPPTTYVGQWKLLLDTVKKEATEVSIHRYVHKDPVYIIFNPWCTDDAVYLEGDSRLKEYVLNQSGGIFTGAENGVDFRPWNFAQFESCVLDVAMYLLDKSDLSWTARGNPILIIRKISALVNSQDDNGLLTGNWTGKYEGGHSPNEWTGSGRIFEKFWKAKIPVRFGQCWVFSGLSTTFCRTLGIPARSVTNLVSAHDKDGTIGIDMYMVNNTWESNDSVWNFHVWNEAWMARPDLPSGYGGWQAFDATPQKTSDGIVCCGPASVRAIREGQINLPYDAPFVFSEVNADKVFWVKDFMGQWQCADLERDCIGKCISTKSVGSNDREDLTDQYKPKEGSAAERISVSCAYLNMSQKDISTLNEVADKDVKFSLSEAKVNNLGEDFELLLTMKNTSDKVRTVSGYFEVSTMYYTGIVADQLKKDNLSNVTLQPNGEMEYKISVPTNDYDKKLKDFGMFDFSMWASVQETGQYFVKKGDYRLHKPHLKVKAPTHVTQEDEIQVEVSFINPLNRALTNCFVLVDGISPSTKFRQGDVAPGATFSAVLPIKPNKVGKAELIVNFNSDELQDVNASQQMKISKALDILV